MAIDIRHLRYFLAVAAERSFTQGARRLNMAQAPLSKRIQELEEELSVPLFDRDRRPITLTPAGRLLQEEALRVVRGLDQLEATMRRFVANERPRFVIGLVPSTLYARLPEIIATLRQEIQGIDVALAEMDSLEQVAALKDGRIDVGFDRIVVDDPLIVHKVIRDEPVVAAFPAGRIPRLAGDVTGLNELTAWPLIVYPAAPRPSYADLTLAFFRERGLEPLSILEVRELQTALVMVASGAGVCLVPASVRSLARPDIDYFKIVEAPRVPFLMRRRVGPMSASLKKLVNLYD